MYFRKGGMFIVLIIGSIYVCNGRRIRFSEERSYYTSPNTYYTNPHRPYPHQHHQSDYPISSTYYYTGPSGADEPNCYTEEVAGGGFMENALQFGATKLGLLGLIKATVAALATGLIAKFPFLLLKLAALPFVFGLPLLLPYISVMSASDNSSNSTLRTDEHSRWLLEEGAMEAIKMFSNSQHCLQRVACHLGARSSHQPYSKTIILLLKKFEMSASAQERHQIRLYREGYMDGARNRRCEHRFQCDIWDYVMPPHAE